MTRGIYKSVTLLQQLQRNKKKIFYYNKKHFLTVSANSENEGNAMTRQPADKAKGVKNKVKL